MTKPANSNATPSPSFNSPEAVMQLVTELNRLIDKQDEMAKVRMLPRREIVLPILIQLLDDEKRPCSETLPAVSLDISFAGMAFLCQVQEPVAAYALVQFSESLGQHRTMVVDIKNQKTLGPFCKMGGVFYVDWSDSIDLL